jgi:putative MATE family efflux protein
MPPSSDPDLDKRRAAQQVEADLEELGDPETSPSLPATTLVTQAGASVGGGRLGPLVPVSTTREILRLSWPVMLSQTLVSAAGLVDRAMVGHLGGDGGAAIPLAAVGFATQLFFLLQSALFAVGLACVALMARAIGARDPLRARQMLVASLQVAVVVSGVFTIAMLAGARPVLGWLGAEPAVVDAAVPYLNLVVGTSMFLAVALVLDSALRANKNMRTPMWISVAVTTVKLLGNWVLIFGNLGLPRLELLGAGVATALAQTVAVALFLGAALRAPADSPLALRLGQLRARPEHRREVIRIAVPGIAERIVMNLALLAYFWVLSSYYGTLSVAVYTVGVALLSFSWIPGSAYAQACATLVGQALGAGDRPGAIRAGWRSAGLALITAVVLGAIFGWARTPLAELFTEDVEVIVALGPFMLALAIAQPFLQLHFTLGGAHRGAGDTVTPLVAATLSNWALRLPLAYVCAAYLQTPVVWVWYALLLDHTFRAAYLAWSFHRGRWQTPVA